MIPQLERRPMIRIITRWCVLGLLLGIAASSPAFAQARLNKPPEATAHVSSLPQGEIRGMVADDKGQPLAGAVVSALGTTTLFAVSDANGRFLIRNVALGPYLVRAHRQGYVPARARVVQVGASQRSDYVLSMTRTAGSPEPPAVLTAGLGGGVPAAAPAEHDHDERAWRLRHAKRSVLKDAGEVVAETADDESLFGGSLHHLGRAVGSPARLASALFADLPLNGQINLLTTSAFDRPQDLFALDAAAPKAVAYMSLVVPGDTGQWLIRGTITQGDLASWIVSGSYRRQLDAAHAYEAGLSYSAQRYLGANTEALEAMSDASRNVGSMYAYDNWRVLPRVRVGYGAQYARYDYLENASLLSPRASLTVQPLEHDPLRLRAVVSHRESAPGAIEYMPSTTGLWLPPERTFSQISRAAFRPERLDHIEVSAEREWAGAIVVGVRAFQQDVEDQTVTMFGLALADSGRGVGHYHVGSAGDFSARGWGVSVSRAVSDGVRASVDYTQSNATWSGYSSDATALARLAPGALRSNERIHDVTATLDSVVAPSATRLFVVYKVNSTFAGVRDTFSSSLANARFNVQVNQSLPFISHANATWEVLAAVSNLFSDDAFDGSVYEESLVVRPPKRILGGVTVRF
jgi:hypothetical protein